MHQNVCLQLPFLFVTNICVWLLLVTPLLLYIAVYGVCPPPVAFGVLKTITVQNYQSDECKKQLKEGAWHLYELLYHVDLEWNKNGNEFMINLVRRVAEVSRAVIRAMDKAQSTYPAEKRAAPPEIIKLIDYWPESGCHYPGGYKFIRPAFRIELELAKRAADKEYNLSSTALEAATSVCVFRLLFFFLLYLFFFFISFCFIFQSESFMIVIKWFWLR